MTGNDHSVGEGINALLAGLGIASAQSQVTAEEVAAEFLSSKGLDAKVLGVRWGTLTLEADSATIRLLSYDRDALLAALEARLPGAVSSVQLRTRRKGA